MRLTRASQYAIGALVHMACKPDGISASHDIARAEGIPERFLLKVLKPLVSARVLYSVKGPHGGYRLAKPAKEITLLDVVEAVDGPISGQVDFTGGSGQGARLCQELKSVFEQAASETRRQFQRVRIADLAKEASRKARAS
jgi:Rrf2 family protein